MSVVQDLLAVLTPQEKRRVPLVVVPMLAVAALEVFGVGGFLPLVTLASDPQRVLAGPWGPGLELLTRSQEPSTVLLRLGGLLLLLFVIKAILTAVSNYLMYRFSYDVQVSVSRRMLKELLARDYQYFLGTNSAVLVKNMTSEVLTFTGGVLIPCLILLSQGVIVLALTTLLALISPGIAIGVAIGIFALSGALFLGINRRLGKWGNTREQRLSDLSRVAHQAISGIKVVKAMGGERRYLADFESHGESYATSNTWYQTAANTPTLLIELIVFGGGVAVILYYTSRGMSLTALLPSLALLGAAAYRLLPAARLMFAMSVTIRYNWPALAIVREGVRPQEAARSDRPAPTNAPILTDRIVLDDVSYRYPNAKDAALSRVSFSVPAGTSLAIVGSSGAGKTTVTDIVLALFEPTEGALRVDGIAIDRTNRESWQRQLGYVPQLPFIADASVRDNVAFGVDRHEVNDRLVVDSLHRASLGELLRTLPAGLDTPLGENGVRLSGGERQRLAIARALYRRPRVLLLDEATSALDTLTERAINEELLQLQSDLTLIIVAHRLSTVRSCKTLVLLNNGRVSAIGNYDELVQRNPEFAAMDRQARHVTEPAIATEYK
jgi:ABC-type multidrug transport system fused ATPase/permease subunit